MPNDAMLQWLAGLGLPPEILAMAKNITGDAKAPAGGTAPPASGDAVMGGVMGDLLRQMATALPRPMQPDCKPVHGKVPGPRNHLLCEAHGHVVDIDAKMIIAEDIAGYRQMAAVADTVKTVGKAAARVVGAVPGGKAAIGAVKDALTALPQPMQPDCKIVRNKVPGPRSHVLCATHGHVVDTDTGMIIAKDVADYKARVKTAAVDTAKTIGKAVVAGVEAIPGGKTAIDAVKGAVADAAKLPRPMQPDCKLVHGKVPGPKNHLLCAAHGHVVDIQTNMIIANDVAGYKETTAAAKVVQGVVAKAVTAVESAAADAKKRADAEAAAKNEAEIDKAVGVVPVEISLLVNGLDGPANGLKLLASASPDHGAGEGRGYINELRDKGAGLYAGKGVPIPPTGILFIGTDKETTRFDALRYTAPSNGVLRLKATETSAQNAKIRHFEIKVEA